MKQPHLFRALASTALVLSLAACGDTADDAAAPTDSEATASDDAADPIAQRQENFEAMGDAFKAIRGQLEGDAPDFAVIEESAQTIGAQITANTELFPADTGIDSGADTEALEVIWEKPEDFAGAANDLLAASEALAAAAAAQDLGQVQQAVKELGGTCKACHDVFRLDKD